MMSLRPALKSLLLLTGLVVSACANNQTVTPLATEPDVVSVRIADSAEKASRALDVIAGIEQQRGPATPAVEDYSNAPPAFTQLITVKWTGPIEQITQTLATKAGMNFRAQGQTPPVPLTVNVDVYQQPLVEVLRNIGLQAGQRADLSVDGRGGTIEIRYAPVDKL